MKSRGQTITDDGFEKNVADKMPKVKKEDLFPPSVELEVKLEKEEPQENIQEVGIEGQEREKEIVFEPPKTAAATDKNVEVSGLIEDLHAQILILGRTKRALEMDLASQQKAIHQLTQDNQELRGQREDLSTEVQKLREVQAESLYLREENTDALERMQELQQKLKALRETLELTIRERDEGRSRVQELEAQVEENEMFRVKGKLKEKEASLFAEENRDLRARLEEVLAQNVELERKCMNMRKSFSEMKESLTLLRDSCKTNVYNLPDPLE